MYSKLILCFRVAHLSERESLLTLLDALIDNMKRYPEDQLSIYNCLSGVGKKHHSYVGKRKQLHFAARQVMLKHHSEHYLRDILKLDPRFLPREPNVEDATCTLNISIQVCYNHSSHVSTSFQMLPMLY